MTNSIEVLKKTFYIVGSFMKTPGNIIKSTEIMTLCLFISTYKCDNNTVCAYHSFRIAHLYPLIIDKTHCTSTTPETNKLTEEK